jgi:predicted component of type VI protein secretion system
MPWIIVSANGEELERRELRGPLVIGRSPECDLAVRDLLLSRTHCRVEPVGRGGWKVVDLNSRNGTRVGWQRVQTHALRDGDHLRMGRTRIEYHAGAFEPAPYRAARRADKLVRPADPHEALSGTVTDFVLLDDEDESSGDEVEAFFADRPFPQPRPRDPASYGEAVTQSLLEELASASRGEGGGGVATMELARPRAVVRAALPRPAARTVYREVRMPRAIGMDFSLQADARHLPAAAAAVMPSGLSRGQKAMAVAGFAAISLVGTGIVVMSLWLLTMAPA